MFSLGFQFGFGIALALIVVEVTQYVVQTLYSRHLGHKIKKLIKELIKKKYGED